MIDRETTIREFFPLVRTIARRVARMVAGAEFDDLVGDGCVGLIRAVDSFDPSYGVTLGRYARHVILGAMLNGVRRLDPVSERVRRTMRDVERERYALANAIHALPTMQAMEEKHPHVRRARTEVHRATALSLDAPLPDNERIAIDFSGDPQVVTQARRERGRVHRAIAALPKRQRHVIVQHYFAERSLRVLGEEMAVSPQRVSQLHLLAIGRLRRDLAAAE
jgi:RNA polymerase sigma factor (sigma-70 family)